MGNTLKTKERPAVELKTPKAGHERMEKALRESEEKFSKAFRSSPDTITITTLEDGKFVEVNDSFTRITGYSREELIGRTAIELNFWVQAEDRARMVQMVKEQGRVSNEEFNIRMKSGEIRTWLFSAEPINICDEPCLITATNDITERKKREQLQQDENYVLTLLGQGAELSELLDAIVRLGERHDPSIKGSVLLFDPSKECLVQASAPSLPDDYKELLENGVPVGPKAGSCGTAAYLKERVTIPDIESSPLFKPFEEVVKRASNNGLLACWSQPIISSNGDLLGTIANYGNKVGEPAADDLMVLEWSARIAAIAIERKRAEEALANEAIRRRILIEQSRDGIVIIDQNGKVYEANQRFAEMLGYSHEEALQLHVWDWEFTFPREQVADMLRSVDETGDHFKTQHLRKDGTTFDVEISTNGATFEGQKLIFCVCRDITERKQAEEALAESERFSNSLLENSPNPIIVTNLDTSVRYVNPAFEKLTGFSSAEITGSKAPQPWWPEESKEELTDISIGDAKSASNRISERIYQKKSGELFWVVVRAEPVMENGELKYFLINWVDITERRQAEEALRINEERLRLVTDNATDMISHIQMAPTIRTDYVSPSCFSITGYKQEEFYADPNLGLEIVHPEDREFLQKSAVPDKKNPHKTISIRLRRKDGKVIWVEQTHTIITDEHGKAVAMHVIARDITERKQAEAALRESEEKFSKAFRSSPDSIAITTLKDGRFIEVNDSYTRITGFAREDVIGHTTTELGHWKKPGARERIIRKLKKQGRIINEEVHLHLKSGGESTSLFSAELINIGGEECMISITTDITERKRAEEALAESEEFSTSLLENSANPITVSNPDTSIRYVNPAFEKLTGFTLTEITGIKMPYPWWLEEKKAERLAGVQQGAIDINAKMEQINQKKNGERFWVEINMAPVKVSGVLKYYLSNWVDVTERKQMEAALQENEEKYRNLIENSKDSISVVDLKGNIKFANKASVELTGYSLDEGIGMNLRDMIPIKHWPRSLMKLREAQKGKTVPYFETEIKRKDGTIVPVETGGQAIWKEGKVTGVQIIARDITERKQAEAALRESEEKFSKAFRSSPISISITSLEDGTFIEVNDNFTRFTGYTREEVIGHTSTEINIWSKAEDRDRMARMLEERGRVESEEFDFRKKSGEIRTWLFSAEVINIGGKPCIIVMTVDITERKRAEEKLRLLSSVTEQVSDSIIVTDTDFRVNYINKAARELLGYSIEEMLEKHMSEFDAKPLTKSQEKEIRQAVSSGKIWETVMLKRRKDGSTFLAECSLCPLFDNQGQVSLFIDIERDITERKAAEENLKQAMSNLKKSSAQLAATNKELETFSYSVSHDLRTPLRTIDGFSQALLEDYSDKLDEGGKDYLERLRGASQKMGELIDGLLKLSRLSRSEMHHEKIDLSALAEEITTRLQETEPERQAELVIGKGLSARGDRQLLRVLLENLLGNAWKFTSKCPQARIEFGATRNGDEKAYFIKDNGAGFDMTYADKLFGAFQRLHETTEFPGTGIGLATVQRIINRHGGRVWAEGAVGEGATFYFTLS